MSIILLNVCKCSGVYAQTAMSEAVFDFAVWDDGHELTMRTMEALKKDNLVTEKSVLTLKPTEIAQLGLTGGQHVTCCDKLLRHTLHEVTLPHWIAAQARILTKPIKEGMDRAGILDYLDYIMQFGDSCQWYTVQSMVQLDNAHKSRVFDEHVKLEDISNHQFRFLTRYLFDMTGQGQGTHPRCQHDSLPLQFRGGATSDLNVHGGTG